MEKFERIAKTVGNCVSSSNWKKRNFRFDVAMALEPWLFGGVC